VLKLYQPFNSYFFFSEKLETWHLEQEWAKYLGRLSLLPMMGSQLA
jgi:hypothetical protein